MHKKKYSRKMSYNERMFMAADEICPPVVTQFFFEGQGSFDIERWRDAVEKASSANPGSRLILKGFLGSSRWVDTGITPGVIEVDAMDWDGMGPEGAPFLQKRLMPRTGPTCEVLLIRGRLQYACFRTHHSVMDGRGTLTWIEDIFRALRGENLLGALSTISDLELARAYQKKYRVPFARNSIAPTGKTSGNKIGVTWKRITVPGRFNNILGQVALLIAKEAWKHGDGPVRFSVPADLRHHEKGLRSTANLAIAIYIEVKRDSTPESIALDVKRQLEENRDCMIDRFDPMIRYVPIKLLISEGKSMIRNNFSRQQYGTSGIISNMGKIPLGVFSGGGFTAASFWGIPPSFLNTPYFIGIATLNNSIELILTLPEVLATDNRLNISLDNLRNGLVPA